MEGKNAVCAHSDLMGNLTAAVVMFGVMNPFITGRKWVVQLLKYGYRQQDMKLHS